MHMKNRGGEQSTRDSASTSSRVPCCPLLLSSTCPLPRPTLSSSQSLPMPSNLNSDEPGGLSRTRTTKAKSRSTRDDVSALSLVLCYPPLHSLTVPPPHAPRSPPHSSSRSLSTTATSPEACCAHGGWRRRAEARETARPASSRVRLLPAPARSYPPRLSLRRVAPRSRPVCSRALGKRQRGD